MTHIMGAWFGGGGNYSPPDTQLTGRDLETFSSVAAARRALSDRRESNGKRMVTFAYVNRAEERCYVPCVDADSELWLWFGWDVDDNGTTWVPDYPDAIVSFGPRGGVVVGPA